MIVVYDTFEFLKGLIRQAFQKIVFCGTRSALDMGGKHGQTP